jgi:hypothetical protein
MSKIPQQNPSASNPMSTPGSRDPSSRLAHAPAAEYAEPDTLRGHYSDGTVCSHCGAVVSHQHWVAGAGTGSLRLAAGVGGNVTCPGCRQTAERLPHGIVSVRGRFWAEHHGEILGLIRNQERESEAANPLSRIMMLRDEGDRLVIETTTEKLAQQIGRDLQRAYDGTLEYQWGDGNHLVRVSWER